MDFLDDLNYYCETEKRYAYLDSNGKTCYLKKKDIVDTINRVYNSCYNYKSDKLQIVKKTSGFIEKRNWECKTYVYYEGKEVYPCLKLLSNKKWLTELMRIDEECNKYAMESYERAKKISLLDQKKERVLEDIRMLFPGGYSDSKIIIYGVTIKSFKVDKYLDDYEYKVNASVRLADGTLVLDTYNQVFHPGMWLDYIISLAEQKREKIAREWQEKHKDDPVRILERKIEDKCSPIDDSKFFK